MKLTPKQQKFIEVYAGNGTEAARIAGYTGSDGVLAVTAHDLLKLPKISEAIQKRQKPATDKLIADRAARQSFWTEVMRDVSAEMHDRLKASELLGRSEADFVEKLHVGDANGEPLSIHIDLGGKPKEKR